MGEAKETDDAATTGRDPAAAGNRRLPGGSTPRCRLISRVFFSVEPWVRTSRSAAPLGASASRAMLPPGVLGLLLLVAAGRVLTQPGLPGGTGSTGPGGQPLCQLFGVTCGACVAAGCSWQIPGGCRPTCEPGLLSGVPCFDTYSESCPKPDCTMYSDDCAGCLREGCAWQQAAPQRCQLLCTDPQSCLDPGTLPERCVGDDEPPPEPCSSASDCEDCVAAGCVFQEGKCKDSCDRSGAFIPDGCVDRSSVELGLLCPSNKEMDWERGYCSATRYCVKEPIEAYWCQANAGQCVTGCRVAWCPTDGFCSFNGCKSSSKGGFWCKASKDQCNRCNGEWCLYT